MTTRIEDRYIQRNPGSQKLATRARARMPGGVSQISRDIQPFPLHFTRAEQTRKWSVDGHEIVDYVMGHGALLFGHNHPEITHAVQSQLARGTHFTGPSDAEIELAELMCELLPSAQRVRFTGTGSEAVSLAFRVARAATGKSAIVKFEGHYHGWHDEELVALRPPYDAALTAGVPAATLGNRVVLPPNDLAALARTLESRTDIACVILEPAGGGHGVIPAPRAWIEGVRDLTRKHGVVLIFDEMVSGFRVGPGGFQGATGIVPDLTTLGKALFGGMPAGALAGRADLMDLMKAGATPFVAHYGSWNAFPVACASGVATLRMLRDGRAAAHIDAHGSRLRAAFNDVIRRRGVAGRVYGAGSHCHFFLRPWPFGDAESIPVGRHAELASASHLLRPLRIAMWNEGLDFDFANNISAVHGDQDLERAVDGFERALVAMAEDGLVSAS